jgi:deoxycytidylate deaminase
MKNIDSDQCEGGLLDKYNLYGWQPDTNLSKDENFMDMVLLVTRNSQLKQGGMACVIVKGQQQQQLLESSENGVRDSQTTTLNSVPSTTSTTTTASTSSSPSKSSPSKCQASISNLEHSLLSVATNQSLYSENDSDVHAEIVALMSCARRGCVTQGATAYITMPPCKRCFAALVVAGIQRIVTRRTIPPTIANVAETKGIEMVTMLEGLEEQKDRINNLVTQASRISSTAGIGENRGTANGNSSDTIIVLDTIQERRQGRKEEKQQRKLKKTNGACSDG